MHICFIASDANAQLAKNFFMVFCYMQKALVIYFSCRKMKRVIICRMLCCTDIAAQTAGTLHTYKKYLKESDIYSYIGMLLANSLESVESHYVAVSYRFLLNTIILSIITLINFSRFSYVIKQLIMYNGYRAAYQCLSLFIEELHDQQYVF